MRALLAALVVIASILLLLAVFWSVKSNPQKELAVAIVAGATAILASTSAAIYTHYTTKSRELASAHRLQKIEVYSEYGDVVFSIFLMNNVPKRADLTDEGKTELVTTMQSQLQEKYLSFSKKVLLWGSPGVIKRFLEFREFSQNMGQQANKESPMRLLLLMDNVYREMRRDLGLDNSNLDRGDLVKVFLTDPKELDKVLK